MKPGHVKFSIEIRSLLYKRSARLTHLPPHDNLSVAASLVKPGATTSCCSSKHRTSHVLSVSLVPTSRHSTKPSPLSRSRYLLYPSTAIPQPHSTSLNLTRTEECRFMITRLQKQSSLTRTRSVFSASSYLPAQMALYVQFISPTRFETDKSRSIGTKPLPTSTARQSTA